MYYQLSEHCSHLEMNGLMEWQHLEPESAKLFGSHSMFETRGFICLEIVPVITNTKVYTTVRRKVMQDGKHGVYICGCNLHFRKKPDFPTVNSLCGVQNWQLKVLLYQQVCSPGG